MPFAKKSFSFQHYLQTVYATDESSLQLLSHHLPEWIRHYKQLYQVLTDHIKKEKNQSKVVKSSLPALTEDLRIRLSDQLPEHDLLKIMTEALLLSIIMEEEEWQKILHHAHLNALKDVVHALSISLKEKAATGIFQKIKEGMDSLLPAQLHPPVWQYLSCLQQYNTHFRMIPQKAGVPLLGYLNYLLKRKTGLSLNDQDTQILWWNTMENHWEQSLLNCIEPDLQATAMAERILSCKISLMDFGHAYVSYLQDASGYKPSLYWQDPLNSLARGIQTSLFSSFNEAHTIIGKLREKRFSFIGLDLRQPFYPYRYAHRARQSTDQHIINTYQTLGIEEISVDYGTHMVHGALDKLGEQGMLLAIVERKTIEAPQSQSFRQFLEHTFQEIYVLDLIEQEEEGLAILYLVKKSVAHLQSAGVQYASLHFGELLADHQPDFESLKWQKVKTARQNYWIALPESDFFELYPIFDTEQAIFKSSIEGIESFLDDWLMDDDAKLLEKKVKYLLRQYSRASEKGREELDSDIKWPEILKKMAQDGQPLSFDKQKIKKIQIKPFVYAFVYAEEKLLLHKDIVAPVILYTPHLKQVFPSGQPWHAHFFDQLLALPLTTPDTQKNTEENISDAVLKHFQIHYQKRTKEFDQNFIVFPPENITSILDKMESVSRDLPVIRKYPNQISRLLEEARHFTSDVELLTPPYEKIEEFRYKVLRLEKDAIERKIIYQKVKTYIEELKEQLASLTHEHDEARKDYEAVNKENIFYYSCAVLHHPHYRKKYRAFLTKELPRIPMLPKFRQWVQWGKDLFQAHQAQTESENVSLKLQVKEEIHDKPISKSFTYEIDRERGIIILKEQFLQITLSNIPKEAWNYQFEEHHPFAHYLEYLARKSTRNKKIKAQFTQPRLADKVQIITNLKYLCSLSLRLAALENEMQKAHF